MSAPQEYVYHYTKSDTATQHILENMTLRMSPLRTVNDPKESSNRIFTFYTRNLANAVSFDSRLFDQLNADLTNNTFALCCAQDIEVDEAGERQFLGALRPNMWAHYGQNHKGVCLVLDKAALHQKMLEIALPHTLYEGPVDYFEHKTWAEKAQSAYALYLEDLLNDRSGYFNHHVNTYHRDLFFMKHKEWRDECEYRWILRGAVDGPFDIQLDKCLRAVVLGSSVMPETEKEILAICKKYNIPVHQISWRKVAGDHRQISGESEVSEESILLGGISYSMHVPTEAVIVLAVTSGGEPRPLLIGSADGAVRLWHGDGSDTDVARERAKGLGINFNDCGMPQHYVDTFSAGRLARFSRDPPRFEIIDGEIKLADDEEQPYYKRGFTFPNSGV